jgi:hypothetical protein
LLVVFVGDFARFPEGIEAIIILYSIYPVAKSSTFALPRASESRSEVDRRDGMRVPCPRIYLKVIDDANNALLFVGCLLCCLADLF